MPNHIVNEIRVHGVTEQQLRPLISGSDGVIDFATLLPLPINYWPGSVSILHEKAFPGTHLDAATKTWGTKWNAYALNEDSFRVEGCDIVLTFETAWAPPRGWIVALFNTLSDHQITHFWQDEGSDCVWLEVYLPNGGTRTLGGPEWSRSEVEPGSEDHRRLYKLQWGVETPAELEESN